MSAILPEETTRTAVFQIPDYCCEPWFRVQYLQDVDWLDPAWKNHSPDCNVARIFRRIEGEEPVTILNGVEGESSDSVLVWKESLPLTLLDTAVSPARAGDECFDALLGAADGRIGIATPEIIASFNLGVMEPAMRHRFFNYQDQESACRYAISPIESNGNRVAYHEQAKSAVSFASMYFTSDDGMFPAPSKRPSFQEIRLDKTIRKFNGGFFKCAVLPNGRWVVYDPERYATFQKGHDNA